MAGLKDATQPGLNRPYWPRSFADTCATAKIMKNRRLEPVGEREADWAMYFPQFLVGMATACGFVAAWAYVATGSIWKAFVWCIIAAVLMQVGYFALVFWLVYGRRDAERKVEETPPDVPHQPLHRDGR